MKWPWRKRDPIPLTVPANDLARSGRKDLAEMVLATTRELDRICDILTGESRAANVETANPYPTRQRRIEQLVKCYRGEARWGGGIIRRLLNLRRGYQMPGGVRVRLAEGHEGAEDALAYIRQVLDDNDMAEGRGQQLVRERELEGQVLVQIAWTDDNRVVLRHRPWRQMEYEVVPVEAENPNGLRRAIFRRHGAIVETLEDDEFAFVAFNSEASSFVGHPELGDVLVYAENADRALYAWRAFNALFAHLTPFFETADPQVAVKLREYIQTAGWKLGLAVAANAKMSLVGPTEAPAEMLRAELVANVQMICGLTGVEPQDIGFPDVLSNRAVATEMGEPQEIAVAADATMWAGFFEDLFRKVIRMRNRALNGQLDENAVVADLRSPAGRAWTRLKEVFLPAATAPRPLIDRQTFLEQVPDLDVPTVMARLAEQDERDANRALAEVGINPRSLIDE